MPASTSPNVVTSIDLSDPQHLLAVAHEVEPAPSFLIDTYFPTNPVTDIFKTKAVLIDYQDGNRRVAPFVKRGGSTSQRDGFYTDQIKPARIAPERPLTLDDLQARGFGEAVFSNSSEAERAAAYTLADFTDLTNRIIRRTEAMASELLTTNKLVIKYEDDPENPVTVSYDTNPNATIYTPAHMWDSADADIYGDIFAMILALKRRSCQASDLIVGAGAGSLIMNNPVIQKLLDNRRFEVGEFSPELAAANASILCKLNVNGHLIRVIQYVAEYENEEGNMTPFIPSLSAILTAPGAGRCLYGAVTQIEEQGGPHVTYADKRVPKFVSDVDNDERKFRLTSRPILAPNRKGAWMSATVAA